MSMSHHDPRGAETHRPAPGGNDHLIDAWLRRELSDAYDRALGETLPEELVALVCCACPASGS
jgi:hypothetical protein